MANNERTDRQLMRQRGAGLRNVNNVDFGLKFGSQDSREDRQLMRQRGAGNRKIDSIDFGFAFPTPGPFRRSTRTPQSVRRSIERSSKTPFINRTRQSSIDRTLRTTPVKPDLVFATEHRLSKTPQRRSVPEQPNSSKRRRISGIAKDFVSATLSVNSPLVQIPQILQNTRLPTAEQSVQEEPSGDVSTNGNRQAEEDLLDRPSQPESPLFVPQDADKENEIFANHAITSVKGRRKSKLPPGSPGNDITRNRPEDVVESVEDVGTGGSRLMDDAEIHSTGLDQQGLRDLDVPASTRLTDVELPVEVTVGSSSATAKKRKKRKSVVLGPRKRRSSEGIGRNSVRVNASTPLQDNEESLQLNDQAQDEQELETADSTLEPDLRQEQSVPLWKKLMSRRAQKRRNRLSVSVSPAPRGHEDEEADGTYVDEEDSPEPPTPAVRKKATSRANRRWSDPSSNSGEVSSRANQTSFPIITHRITNTEALPTIMEESENEGDAETEGQQPFDAIPSRSQPNAVDVLAQICRETIQTAMENMESNAASSASRSELKQKRTALEAFGDSLDQRLFDISQATEQRMVLEARLRKSKREKAELQARWIEVRRQRDELAFKADTIRRQNWESEEEGKRQFDISELAYKTELELERGESGHDDLEFMLRRVAASVSSATGQGGILNRVKAFNSRLEKMAMALGR